MKKLHIALLQISPTGTLEGNLQKGISACRKAKSLGADIALFPEMFSIGYDIYDRPAEEWTSEAINADDGFVTEFGKLAANLEMAVGITFLEKHIPKPKNTLILFDRHGETALKYSKVHTCDFDAESALCAGDGFYVCELDTSAGKIKTGAMICFDREFPESARILMLKGAEIILAPNACPMEINRLSALRTRAYENMCAVATCNYPDTVPDCNGHSTVFDGVAWLSGEEGVRDMCILESDGSEGIFIAELDVEMLREYRAHEVMGDKFRKPQAYGEPIKNKAEREFPPIPDIPRKIREIIGGMPYTADNIGMSGCGVYLFDKFVLKIESNIGQAAETVGIMQWLHGKLPVPEVIKHCISDGRSYLLMSRVGGKMSCDEYYLEHPHELLKLLADALKMLWSIDISDCPRVRDLDTELSEARQRVENGLVDTEHCEPDTFGADGFKDPAALLEWLENNKPPVEPVLSHGDFCLPNVFLDNGRVSGFIDLGDCGIADKWRDISLCWRSLKHNSDGTFGGKIYPDFDAGMLFDVLGITHDHDKLRYYLLLDELF